MDSSLKERLLNREVTSLTISNTGVGLTDGTYTNVSTTTNNGGTGLTADTVSGAVTAATVNQPGLCIGLEILSMFPALQM